LKENPVNEPIVWRSLLYVPANNPRFIDKAHTRGADGIILDLEDSVPLPERDAARGRLATAAATVGQSGADVLVRINRPWDETLRDIEAAVIPGVHTLMVAKTESVEHLRQVAAAVEEQERARGMADGSIHLMPMIETPAAYFHMQDIAAASPRNIAITLGGEDFALETGMVPDGETLFLPNQVLVYAARAAGIVPLGTFGTVADYDDLDAYALSARKSRRFGFEGASCIHPSVVPVLNAEFAPSAEEVDHARRVVEAYEAAEADGTGAIAVDGKMVDVPVAVRARRLLDRHEAIAKRTG